MDSKLTLTIEKELIEKAKVYARKKGRSLSDLIENYLKLLTNVEKETEQKPSPLVKSLKGSFKVPADFDYKKTLKEELTKRNL